MDSAATSAASASKVSESNSTDIFRKIQQELDDRRMAKRLGRRESRNLDLTIAEISRQRAKWMADDALDACPICSRPWDNVILWKHHCRACGTLVCDDCSANVAVVVGYNDKERVCDTCFVDLSAREGRSPAAPLPRAQRRRVVSSSSSSAAATTNVEGDEDAMIRIAIEESLRHSSVVGTTADDSEVRNASKPKGGSIETSHASKCEGDGNDNDSDVVATSIRALQALGFGWTDAECAMALESHSGSLDAATEHLIQKSKGGG